MAARAMKACAQATSANKRIESRSIERLSIYPERILALPSEKNHFFFNIINIKCTCIGRFIMLLCYHAKANAQALAPCEHFRKRCLL